MSKKITVIIPCFNEVNTIKVLIKKILRLKINIEIILVDDSTDDPINVNILKNFPYYIDFTIIIIYK